MKIPISANLLAIGGSMYSINESNGVLSQLAESTIATGNSPWSISVSSSGQYAYVVNFSDNTVSMYSISESSGELSPLTESIIATESSPQAIASVKINN